MFKRGLQSLVTIWFTGLIALLPLLLTVALLAWIVSLLNGIVGPSTFIGEALSMLGQPVATNRYLAYTIGTLALLAFLFPLGLAVTFGLRRPLAWLVKVTLQRVPLIGSIYSLADRMVRILDRNKNADINSMSPVWCFFGGEDGAAVLGLLPSGEIIDLEGRPHYAILIPSAPIPVGGGLIYVPVEWTRPANIGVDTLTSIYVSMGLTPPPPLPKREALPSPDAPSLDAPSPQEPR